MTEKEDLRQALNDIYPLTVMADRYGGAYSDGDFTAWNKEPWNVPQEVDGDDVTCYKFWEIINKTPAGRGGTPEDAILDLYRQLKERGDI